MRMPPIQAGRTTGTASLLYPPALKAATVFAKSSISMPGPCGAGREQSSPPSREHRCPMGAHFPTHVMMWGGATTMREASDGCRVTSSETCFTMPAVQAVVKTTYRATYRPIGRGSSVGVRTHDSPRTSSTRTTDAGHAAAALCRRVHVQRQLDDTTDEDDVSPGSWNSAPTTAPARSRPGSRGRRSPGRVA